MNNPFLASSSPSKTGGSGTNQANSGGNKETKPAGSMIDFLLDNSAKTAASINQSNSNENDLFSLDSANPGPTLAANNPFADILSSLTISPTTTGANKSQTSGSSEQFATSDGFAAAFGNSSNSNIGNYHYFFLTSSSSNFFLLFQSFFSCFSI